MEIAKLYKDKDTDLNLPFLEPGVVPEYIGYNEIIAAVTVLIGNYLQNRAHVGLASLRKGKGTSTLISKDHMLG